MNKTKKIVSLMLCCIMLLGVTLSASAATRQTFDFVPSDHRCLNSGCGYAPLRQSSSLLYWYCPDVNCGWQYLVQY